MPDHSTLTGPDVHGPWEYFQEANPGAIGAFKYWQIPSSGLVYQRNAANSSFTLRMQPVTPLAGGGLPNTTFLTVGSNWTDFMTAYNAAPDNPAAPHSIYWPDDTIIQTAHLRILKSIRLLGSGPNSCIEHQGNLPGFGSNIAIAIGSSTADTSVQNVELANFKIKCNRTIAPTTTRTTAIWAMYNTRNLNIHHMIFEDISSSCFYIDAFDHVDPRTQIQTPNRINFSYNLGDEWYEQFMEIEHGRNINASFNNCTTTQAHPNSAVTRPRTFYIGMERTPDGVIEDVTINNNYCNVLGVPQQGLAYCMNFPDPQEAGLKTRMDRVIVSYNRIIGGNYGIRMGRIRNFGEASSVYLIGNTISDTLQEPIGSTNVSPVTANVYLFQNVLVVPSGKTGGWNTEMSTNYTGFNASLNEVMELNDGVASYTEFFTGADSDTLGGSQPWSELVGDWDRSGNAAAMVTIDTDAFARCNTLLDHQNHYMEALINYSAETGAYGGVCVRFYPIAQTCYYAKANFTENTLEIWRLLGGLSERLAVVSETIAGGIILRLEVTGSTLTLKVGGVTKLTITDTRIEWGLQQGLYARKNTSGNITFDSVAAGTL